VINKIIKSAIVLFLFTGIYTYASAVDLSPVCHTKKTSPVNSVSKRTSKDTFDAFLNYNSAAQISSQSFKQIHAHKFALALSTRVLASVNFLSLYTRSHTSGLAQFYKLILFPFHAFW